MKKTGCKRFLAGSLVVAGIVSLWGTQGSAMTLSEAVEQALANNPGLRSERVKEKIEETRLTEAAGSYLPVVAVGESFISTDNPLNAFGILLN